MKYALFGGLWLLGLYSPGHLHIYAYSQSFATCENEAHVLLNDQCALSPLSIFLCFFLGV